MAKHPAKVSSVELQLGSPLVRRDSDALITVTPSPQLTPQQKDSLRSEKQAAIACATHRAAEGAIASDEEMDAETFTYVQSPAVECSQPEVLAEPRDGRHGRQSTDPDILTPFEGISLATSERVSTASDGPFPEVLSPRSLAVVNAKDPSEVEKRLPDLSTGEAVLTPLLGPATGPVLGQTLADKPRKPTQVGVITPPPSGADSLTGQQPARRVLRKQTDMGTITPPPEPCDEVGDTNRDARPESAEKKWEDLEPLSPLMAAGVAREEFFGAGSSSGSASDLRLQADAEGEEKKETKASSAAQGKGKALPATQSLPLPKESERRRIPDEALIIRRGGNLPHIMLPKEYAHVNVEVRKEIDIDNLQLHEESTEGWRIYERIGRGKYSEVFEGRHEASGEVSCVKILKPCLPKLLKLEIYVLQQLSRGPNIIELRHVLKDPKSDVYCLVFEILKAKEFKDLLSSIKDKDLRYYLYQMLKGLNYAHSQGIMHRDVKPQNILVDTDTREVRIIDWGLGSFYYPGQEYSVRVATRAYKAPELLVDYQHYHYAVDMWAFGCMFAGIIFHQKYFFHGHDDQLDKIVQVLGTEEFHAFLRKYNIPFNERIKNMPNFPKKDLRDFLSDDAEKNKFITKNSLDLVTKLLRFDPQERLTAKECLMHPYFESVRKREERASRRASKASVASDGAILLDPQIFDPMDDSKS